MRGFLTDSSRSCLAGVVLKMARLVREVGKDGKTTAKSDAVREASRKPPMKTVYIHHGDFVQIVAKVGVEDTSGAASRNLTIHAA